MGPVLKGRKEFDAANVNAYSGEKTLETPEVGTITFTLTAGGPPSFQWTGPAGGSWSVAENWTETSTGFNRLPTSGGDVVIPSDQVNLSTGAAIASLCIGGAAQLNLTGAASELTLNSGFVDNKGLLILNQGAALQLNGTTSMLCGPGYTVLNGGSLSGYTGPEDFSFINYNLISGGGDAMVSYDPAGGNSTIHNLGTFRATSPAPGSDYPAKRRD